MVWPSAEERGGRLRCLDFPPPRWLVIQTPAAFAETFPAFGAGPQLLIDSAGTMYVIYPELAQASLDNGSVRRLLLIVSADHGESLGELGLYAEHGLASEPVHHLPRGARQGEVVDHGVRDL